MQPIICENNVETVIDKIQKCLKQGMTIKGIYLVDSTEKEAVIVVDEQPIDERIAEVWWNGYKAGFSAV